MTDNTVNTDGPDAGSGSALIVDAADEKADSPAELTKIDDFPGDLDDSYDEDPDGDGVTSTGAVSGGFGFAGLALALVSLTTNWTSGVVVSHGQFSEEVHASSSGLTAQQQLNMYANGWHTQGWWALAFAAAAVLCGGGALVGPGILSGRTAPGWARAAAAGAIIVGLVGVLLAVLTVTGVVGGNLTAPASTG